MPRFPTYERQLGLSGGSTASFASDSAFTAPARALGGLGDAVAGVGDQFAQVENKIRETQDDTWFTKARAETVIEQDTKEREFRTGATGEAGNYTPQVRGGFDEIRKSKVAAAPSQRAAQMYEQWATGYDVDVTRRSASFQAESELAKRTSDFADAMNLHAQAILADPSQFDAVQKRAMDDFEGAKQWMTPEQETLARAKVDHDLKLARAKSLVEFAPEDFLAETGGGDVSGDAAVNTVVDRIIGVESGGKASAKNPNSSASGLGQFIDSTWISTVRKHRPDMAGLSNTEILRFKNDRKLGREMTTRFTEDNAKELQAAGLPTTPGNLYLAHFAGVGGAKAVLRAEDGQSTNAVLGPAVVNANGFLRGKTVGWLKSWAAKKMGGKGVNVVGKPQYEGLSVDELRSLQNSAESTVKSNQAVAYSQLKDSFSLGIQTGNVISEDQILGSSLDDGDKATLISQFRTARKDDLGAVSFIEGITDKNLSVDPFDTDARKNADNAAKMVKEKFTPEQYQSYTEEVARQTGLVSKDVVNDIRKGLQSTNAQEVAAAAQRASRISSIDPAALGRRDGGGEVQTAADDFNHYVNDLNMTPDEAAKKLIENKDPEKMRDRKAMEPAAKEFIKEMETVSIGDQFDTWLGSEPDVGFSPGQELGIKAEWLAIAEEQFYAAHGDPELAKNRATEQMKRLYGVTGLTGKSVVMKHPPEKYWPMQDDGVYGKSLTYAQIQLRNDLSEFSPDVDMSKVQLVTTPETDAMVKRGEMPGYAVLYTDESGVLQTIPGKLWRPDTTQMLDFQRQQEQTEQLQREDNARALQKQERQQIPYRTQKPEDFLSGNDPTFGAR